MIGLKKNGSFGEALEILKRGGKVCREGWNGKGMWLKEVRKGVFDVGVDTVEEGNKLLPWIGMKTADDCFVPWLASQTDMLAEDWMQLKVECIGTPGHKVTFTQMSEFDFRRLWGKTPSTECVDEDGFLIEDIGSNRGPNMEGYEGFITWMGHTDFYDFFSKTYDK